MKKLILCLLLPQALFAQNVTFDPLFTLYGSYIKVDSIDSSGLYGNFSQAITLSGDTVQLQNAATLQGTSQIGINNAPLFSGLKHYRIAGKDFITVAQSRVFEKKEGVYTELLIPIEFHSIVGVYDWGKNTLAFADQDAKNTNLILWDTVLQKITPIVNRNPAIGSLSLFVPLKNGNLVYFIPGPGSAKEIKKGDSSWNPSAYPRLPTHKGTGGEEFSATVIESRYYQDSLYVLVTYGGVEITMYSFDSSGNPIEIFRRYFSDKNAYYGFEITATHIIVAGNFGSDKRFDPGGCISFDRNTREISLFDPPFNAGIEKFENGILVTKSDFSGGTSGYAVYSCLSNTVVLPIKILDFSATLQNGSVLLLWNISPDAQNVSVEIERSPDGKKFTNISTAPVSVDVGNYRDLEFLQGENYYRLKVFRKDGTFSYSSVNIVRVSSTKNYIYPNPAHDYIQWYGVQSVPVVITDLSGKIVKIIADGSKKISIANLQMGVYLISCIQNKKRDTKMFIKK